MSLTSGDGVILSRNNVAPNDGCVRMTLDRTVLDLCTPMFAHGQLYTALSHLRKREDFCVLLSDDNVHCETNNITCYLIYYYNSHKHKFSPTDMQHSGLSLYLL